MIADAGRVHRVHRLREYPEPGMASNGDTDGVPL